MTLLDSEIEAMVELAERYQTQLILAIGPRATTDTSASAKTEEGKRIGYRLRGQDQIVRSIEEVKRASRLGVRGFLVYDEGCLWVLDQARKAGEIPSDCHFKMSAHAGVSNPCSARLMETIGLDSINRFVIFNCKCYPQYVKRRYSYRHSHRESCKFGRFHSALRSS